MSESARWVPRLRFPEFRAAEAWKVCAGSDLFDQVNERNAQADLPVLAITQEHGAIPRELIDYHVSVTDKSLESYKVVQPGDFIISLRSFQGGIEYSEYRGVCSPAYVILRRRGEGSDAYFKHYLKTVGFIQLLTRNLEGLRDGKMISYKQFSELRLPVPAEAEQQKIADCLSSLDELIAAQGRKVDAQRAHKQGLLAHLFPQVGTSRPRARFRDGKASETWKKCALKEVFSVFQGFAFSSEDGVTDGVRWLKIADVGVLRMNHDTPSFLPLDFKERFERFSVLEGDYVIALTRPIVGSQLKVAQVGRAFAGALINQRVGKLVTNQCASFVYYLLQCQNTINGIEKSISGSEPPNLSVQQIADIEVLLPQIPEQQRIADCLSAVDQLINAATLELDALKTHRQALMQQLFPSAEALQA